MKHKLKLIPVFLLLSGLLVLTVISSKKTVEESQALTPEFDYQHLFRQDGMIVLVYHRVLKETTAVKMAKSVSKHTQLHTYNVPLNAFEKQMAYLDARQVAVYSVPDMIAQMKAGGISGRSVAVTFDDIDITMYRNALPVLKQYNIPFTTFIVTGQTSNNLAGSQLASWTQITEIAADPLVTIGLHSHDLHYTVKGQPALVAADDKQLLIDDYTTAQQQLAGHVNQHAQYYAYPYGAASSSLTNYLTRNGIDAIFTLEAGLVTNSTDTTAIPRVIVTEENWEVIVDWLEGST